MIDDDEAVNFVHRLLLEKVSPGIKHSIAWNGQEAVDFLKSIKDSIGFPQLILLDINMPVLDGWGFLEAFAQFDTHLREGASIVIITASMNPDDIKRSQLFEDVKVHMSKPLNTERLESIYKDLFAGTPTV